MEAYKKYMDKITVSDSLHQRIISSTDHIRTKNPSMSIMIKRYIAVSACFVVILLGVFILPRLIQNNILHTPGDNPPTQQPGLSSQISGGSSKYTLDFNKASVAGADQIAIKGHFWQELNSEEMKVIFPSLAKNYKIDAMANFESDNNIATLFNIDANVESKSGFDIYIQIAPSEIVLDYIFDSKPKSSEVLGTTVKAGYFETKANSKGLRNIIYFAEFKLSDIAYYVEIRGAAAEKETLKNEITNIIGHLIEGGPADIDVFDPVIPELQEKELNINEAYADIDFGAYLPKTLPDGFVFEDSMRFINQEENTLYVNWTKGMGYINWQVSNLDTKDKMRISSVADIKNYDLSLYPIPLADSVPEELRQIVDDPIFYIDELTIDTVKARTYEIEDAGDELGTRMNFSVIYGDILVELRVKDVSSEEIFEILQQIKEE